jgi:5-carboxymethyl-2-hydroxymuconate isomerase
MPHIWIDYSANLEERLDVSALVDEIHGAAVRSGIFPAGGIRTRARADVHYRIADTHPDNGFVHVVVRIAAGRDQQTKKDIGTLLFSRLCQMLEPVYASAPLGLSLEVQELDAELNFKKNNLQEYVDRREHAQRD